MAPHASEEDNDRNPADLNLPQVSDYGWLAQITRVSWAWEFLRRNPDYRAAYAQNASDDMAASWGLRYFEDPLLDARHASAYWLPEWCSAVLPVAARALLPSEVNSFDPGTLNCRTRVRPRTGKASADVLFNSEGRLLQLEVSGAAQITDVALAAVVIPMPEYPSARALAIRRFTNLVTSGTLQSMLYPPERRAPRLTKVLIAVDYWQERKSYRDIAVRLHGQRRVDDQWNDPRDHLRDQIRRAVYYGRNLMAGGYRQFLH
jgi:hypothetical protein